MSTPKGQLQKLQKLGGYWYTKNKSTFSNFKVKVSRKGKGRFSLLIGAVCGLVMRKKRPALFVDSASFALLYSYNFSTFRTRRTTNGNK